MLGDDFTECQAAVPPVRQAQLVAFTSIVCSALAAVAGVVAAMASSSVTGFAVEHVIGTLSGSLVLWRYARGDGIWPESARQREAVASLGVACCLIALSTAIGIFAVSFLADPMALTPASIDDALLFAVPTFGMFSVLASAKFCLSYHLTHSNSLRWDAACSAAVAFAALGEVVGIASSHPRHHNRQRFTAEEGWWLDAGMSAAAAVAGLLYGSWAIASSCCLAQQDAPEESTPALSELPWELELADASDRQEGPDAPPAGHPTPS
eukprot:7391372-Prymnesium_polylepis.1